MDDSQFERLYEETVSGLRSYLRHLLRDPGAADDLAQESYLRMLGATLPADMSALHQKNYLYRVATNLARNRYRSRRIQVGVDPEALGSAPAPPDEAYDVRDALEALRPKERELLWLAYVESFSHEEIAQVVKARPASIRPMLARARSRLAQIMTRRGYGRR
jgi:RNA polymerase sigma-70 factor, ECF subfamily